MQLKRKELLICLYARGYKNIVGDEESLPDMNEQNRQSLRESLVGHKLLEQDPRVQEGYRFSAYAQVILDTIGKPDVWLEVQHLKMGMKRSLFLRDAFYVCVEEAGENVIIDLLPSLPIFIGGYASVLKDIRENGSGEAEPTAWEEEKQLVKLCVCGAGEKLVMEIDRNGITRQTDTTGVIFKRYDQQSCTNAITVWMLNTLRQMKEKTT